jgi:hypothetical protein
MRTCLCCGDEVPLSDLVSERRDGTFSVETMSPSPGDMTVCLTCGHLMAFADDMSFRELSEEEIVSVAGDRRVLAIQRARAIIKRRKEQ